jgi:hypothetical protein
MGSQCLAELPCDGKNSRCREVYRDEKSSKLLHSVRVCIAFDLFISLFEERGIQQWLKNMSI